MKKVLWITLSLIIFVGGAVLMLNIYNPAKETASNVSGNITEILNTYGDKYAAYSDSLVSGSELLKLIDNNDGVSITVKTGMDRAGTTYPVEESENQSKKKSSSKYINPSKMFRCTNVSQNNNGVISSLTFEQE